MNEKLGAYFFDTIFFLEFRAKKKNMPIVLNDFPTYYV